MRVGIVHTILHACMLTIVYCTVTVIALPTPGHVSEVTVADKVTSLVPVPSATGTSRLQALYVSD